MGSMGSGFCSLSKSFFGKAEFLNKEGSLENVFFFGQPFEPMAQILSKKVLAEQKRNI